MRTLLLHQTSKIYLFILLTYRFNEETLAGMLEILYDLVGLHKTDKINTSLHNSFIMFLHNT